MRPLLFFILLVLPVVGDVLTREAIVRKIEGLQPEAESAEGRQALTVWEEAQKVAAQIEANRAEASEFKDEIEEIEDGSTLAMPEVPLSGDSLEEWVAYRQMLANAIEAANEKKAVLRVDASESALRNVTLGELIAKTKANLVDHKVPTADANIVDEAERQLAVQQKALMEVTLEKFEAEKELIQTKLENLSSRVEKRDEQVAELEGLQAKATEKVNELRDQAEVRTRNSLERVEKALEKIQKSGEFDEDPDILMMVRLVDELQRLMRARSGEGGVEIKLKDAADYLAEIEETKKRIAEQASNASERINLLETAKLGVDSQTGVQLRRQRALLPGIEEMKEELRDNVEEAVQAQIIEMELQNRLANVPLTSEEVDEMVDRYEQFRQEDIDLLLRKKTGTPRLACERFSAAEHPAQRSDNDRKSDHCRYRELLFLPG